MHVPQSRDSGDIVRYREAVSDQQLWDSLGPEVYHVDAELLYLVTDGDVRCPRARRRM